MFYQDVLNAGQGGMAQPLKQPGSVGVVGLGLIGGSLALDLMALGWHVKGLVHRQVTADRAKARGLVHQVSLDPSILSSCEVILLAQPLQELLQPDQNLVQALPQTAVVTDVGSVKTPVLKVWRALHPRFVGSHPMAGRSEAGVEAGLQGLFTGRPWIATPDAQTDRDALEQVHQLAVSLGSDWCTADAEIHDRSVALISHVPVLVSAALLRMVGDERDPEVRALSTRLASTGFADTTRVGGGNPILGRAMAELNSEAILQGLAGYRWSLEQLEQAVLAGHWAQLQLELERTHALRPSFLKSKE